ncbi:MAG: hypothetical protein DWQ35_18630 [Planctomycetota bacterium]|nr:MAG: hypothetical protein DWQ35_18630 [Planctomycetota bacterium]
MSFAMAPRDIYRAVLFVVPMVLWAVFVFWAAPKTGLADELPEVIVAGGDRFEGRFAEFTSAGAARFVTERRQRRDVPLDSLVRWGSAVTAERTPQVVLADGGLLVGRSLGAPIRIEGDFLVVEPGFSDADLRASAPVRIPLGRVSGVLFRLPGNLVEQDQLIDQLRSTEHTADEVILENGDSLAGTIDTLTERDLRLTNNEQQVVLSMRRVVAIRFNPALIDREPTSDLVLAVATSDGSRLVARHWENDQGGVAVTLAGLPPLKIPRHKLAGFQPLGNSVTYLSDVEPHSYRHVPLLEIEWPFTNDRAVGGGWLRHDDRVYGKGLGMHSAARLTYRRGEHRRLEADLAVDASVGKKGCVRFRVFVDNGDARPRAIYVSPLIRGGDPPVPMSLDISNAERINLVVDFAEGGDVGDHANWLDARLVP